MSEFFLGVSENPLRVSPYTQASDEGGHVLPQDRFLLLSGENFLLLDNEFFLLLE